MQAQGALEVKKEFRDDDDDDGFGLNKSLSDRLGAMGATVKSEPGVKPAKEKKPRKPREPKSSPLKGKKKVRHNVDRVTPSGQWRLQLYVNCSQGPTDRKFWKWG